MRKGSSSRSTRSNKRQARAEIFNDENENPFVSNGVRNGSEDGESMDLDTKPSTIFTKSKPKHSPDVKRIALFSLTGMDLAILSITCEIAPILQVHLS